MRVAVFCFLTFLFFSLPVSAEPVLGNGAGGTGRGISNGRGGIDVSGKNPKDSASPKKSSSSGSGSERKKSSGVSASSLSQVQDSFNPDTGWHTVSLAGPADVVNYRGTRKLIVNEELQVACVKSENKKDGTTVEVFFNQEINPRSFKATNVKINGKNIDNGVKFSFSRNGDSVRIQIPAQDTDFSLSLSDVEAFDGEKISQIELGNFTAK